MLEGKLEDEKLESFMRFRVSRRTKILIKKMANERGETEAELARQIITNAAEAGALQDSVDALLMVVRSAMKDVIEPHTERLAKLNAKTGIAAATSMYMNTQAVANAGYDAVSIYEESRKKAVKFVQERQQS